jgi:site-specific recombinase XerD
MATQDGRARDALVEAFRRHLQRRQGVGPVTLHNYVRYVRAFLDSIFGDGPVDLAAFGAAHVIGFISAHAQVYRVGTVKQAGTALRSFFRFLRVEGLRADRLEEAVPGVVERRLSGIPRHLDEESFRRLLSSLDRSSPCALRDRAMILCGARLGLRPCEVVGLRLEDIDWQAGTLRVRKRKTGRGALLPMPHDVGRAITAYLRRERPPTQSRHIFVLHCRHAGAPASPRVFGDAMRQALDRAGIAAPVRGPYILRHTLATRLIRRGASLKQVADILGHRSLEATQIYAKLDLPSLREVALPWPEVAS